MSSGVILNFQELPDRRIGNHYRVIRDINLVRTPEITAIK